MPTTANHDDEILDVRGASRYAKLSKSYLDKARLRGDGPPYYRPAGCAKIFYRRSEIDAWLENGRRRSTSEPATAAE